MITKRNINSHTMDMQFCINIEVQRRDRIITVILGEVEIKKLLAVRRETMTMAMSYKMDEQRKDTKKIYRKQRYEMI
jgi:Zn-finger nucleic acid-binding protein